MCSNALVGVGGVGSAVWHESQFKVLQWDKRAALKTCCDSGAVASSFWAGFQLPQAQLAKPAQPVPGDPSCLRQAEVGCAVVAQDERSQDQYVGQLEHIGTELGDPHWPWVEQVGVVSVQGVELSTWHVVVTAEQSTAPHCQTPHVAPAQVGVGFEGPSQPVVGMSFSIHSGEEGIGVDEGQGV